MRQALLAALVLLCVSMWLAPAGASAQLRSDTRGFHAGLYLNGSTVTYEDGDEAESGGGLGVSLGWGVSNLLTLYAEGTGADVEMVNGSDTYTLGHFDLGVRFNFRAPHRQWRPWASAGLSGRVAEGDVSGVVVTLSGAGFTVGGGVAYFFSRKLAADVGFKVTAGDFSDAELNGVSVNIDPVSATSSRLNLGIAYWHGRR